VDCAGGRAIARRRRQRSTRDTGRQASVAHTRRRALAPECPRRPSVSAAPTHPPRTTPSGSASPPGRRRGARPAARPAPSARCAAMQWRSARTVPPGALDGARARTHRARRLRRREDLWGSRERLPGRSRTSVAARARRLGLPDYARRWTAADDALLARLTRARTPLLKVARALVRTPDAVPSAPPSASPRVAAALSTGGPCALTEPPHGALVLLTHATSLLVGERFAVEALAIGARPGVTTPPPVPGRRAPDGLQPARRVDRARRGARASQGAPGRRRRARRTPPDAWRHIPGAKAPPARP